MSARADGGISHEQALALLIVADGCDVYSPYLARVLRGIEQQFPQLVDITPPRMPKRGRWDTAYFGAISTPAGVRRAMSLAEWGIAVTVDEETLVENDCQHRTAAAQENLQ